MSQCFFYFKDRELEGASPSLVKKLTAIHAQIQLIVLIQAAVNPVSLLTIRVVFVSRYVSFIIDLARIIHRAALPAFIACVIHTNHCPRAGLDHWRT